VAKYWYCLYTVEKAMLTVAKKHTVPDDIVQKCHYKRCPTWLCVYHVYQLYRN